jgi:predicted YcjX-like family ATPase
MNELCLRLSQARGDGICFVSHKIDKYSLNDRQAISMLSKPMVKEAFEYINDIGIAIDNNRIVVATNSYVAEETLKEIKQNPEMEAVPA